MTVLAGARVVLADEVVEGGWVEVEEGRIAAIGEGSPPARHVPVNGWVVPGFIDLHMHGGGGATVTAGDPDAAERAARFHQRHGTTRTLLSLVTTAGPELVAASSRLAELARASRLADGRPGQVVGIHLEGPFLSQRRCGAQDPEWLCDPDPRLLEALISAGGGTVRVVTIAPELPGGLDLVRRTTAARVVAAVGHSDASYEEARAAFAAGASLVTHLGNGMPPLHHREPGVVGAALDRGVVCELIADGVHLHDATLGIVATVKGADQVALVTDAMAAAGCPDGSWDLGGRPVTVTGGVARLPGADGSLAGSTLTMDAAWRRMVMEVGLPATAASRMASRTPARVLGIDDHTGSIEVGKDADLVVLDEAHQVVAVIARGVVVRGGEVVGVERL